MFQQLKLMFCGTASRLLNKQKNNQQLGHNWIYSIFNRHNKCHYVMNKVIASDQAIEMQHMISSRRYIFAVKPLALFNWKPHLAGIVRKYC